MDQPHSSPDAPAASETARRPAAVVDYAAAGDDLGEDEPGHVYRALWWALLVFMSARVLEHVARETLVLAGRASHPSDLWVWEIPWKYVQAACAATAALALLVQSGRFSSRQPRLPLWLVIACAVLMLGAAGVALEPVVTRWPVESLGTVRGILQIGVIACLQFRLVILPATIVALWLQWLRPTRGLLVGCAGLMAGALGLQYALLLSGSALSARPFYAVAGVARRRGLGWVIQDAFASYWTSAVVLTAVFLPIAVICLWAVASEQLRLLPRRIWVSLGVLALSGTSAIWLPQGLNLPMPWQLVEGAGVLMHQLAMGAAFLLLILWPSRRAAAERKPWLR